MRAVLHYISIVSNLNLKYGINKITLFLILIFLVSLGIAFASIYGVFDRIITGSFYLIPTRAWELLVGVFVAIYFHHFKESQITIFNQLLSLLGLCLVAYSIIFFDTHTPFPSFYTLVPTLGTALIIISTKDTIVNKLLSLKPLVFLVLYPIAHIYGINQFLLLQDTSCHMIYPIKPFFC